METKKTLYRDTDNKMLGGVASGLAEYMGSVLSYILAWIIMPGKYSTSGGLGLGKIFLLILICGLPILLCMLLFGVLIFGMLATFLHAFPAFL